MYREVTVKGRKPGLTSMIWSRRKEETFKQNRMKKQEFKKKERLRNLWDNFKHFNIRIIRVPEEEEEQEIENLLEKNNEGELPQSGKGNRLPGSPGSSDSPQKVGPKEAHTKTHHNYITQD